MNTHQATRYTQFITPLGAIIALVCFFMPWVKIDGHRISETLSGLTCVHSSSLVAIAFVACLLIICSSLYMVIRRTPWKSRVLILINSVIGLGGLWSEYLTYTGLAEMSIGRVENFQVTLRFGVWGTIVGFAVATIGVFLVRTGKTDDQSGVSAEEESPRSIVLSGGIIALICFFMPWEGIGAGSSLSGIDLARRNPLITIALIAGVKIAGISFYILARGTFWKSRKLILISSAAGLGVLFSHYINYFTMLNTVNKTGVEISANTLEFGLWGTFIGFIVTAVGMLLIKTENKRKQADIPTESG